jgi:hypothetical protein
MNQCCLHVRHVTITPSAANGASTPKWQTASTTLRTTDDSAYVYGSSVSATSVALTSSAAFRTPSVSDCPG